MKSTETNLASIEMLAEHYLISLKIYSEEDFSRKADADSWSLGQMYGHLVIGTRFYHLKKIAQCLDAKGASGGKKKLPGRISFFLGSFPPMRVKVPASEEYTPKQPESIGAMKFGLESLLLALRETAKKVALSDDVHKVQHPAFGFLDAREWFQLIEMHFRHHLKQQKRLELMLKQPVAR